MSCLLLMVDADNQESHDDAFADDKSPHFESIDSLKQRDAGQMVILKRRRLPLLDYKQQMDERHVVMKASVAAVAEQPMREIANTFVDYKRQDAVVSDKSDEDTHCCSVAAVSFHERVIFPAFVLPFLNGYDDSKVECVNLQELLNFLRWVYEVVSIMAMLSIGVLV